MRGHDINMTHVIIPCCWTNFWQASVQKQLVLRQVLLHLLPFGLLSFHFDFIKKNKTFDSRFTKVTDAHWYAPLRHDNGQLNSLPPPYSPCQMKRCDAPVKNRPSLEQIYWWWWWIIIADGVAVWPFFANPSSNTNVTLLKDKQNNIQNTFILFRASELWIYREIMVQGGGKFGQFCRVLQSENQSIKT